MSFDFITASKADCLAEAERWLEKGLKFEAEGKSEKFIGLALDRAAKAEAAAYDGRG